MHPKTVALDPQRCAKYEPLYDVDPSSGATVEVFYADRMFDGMRAGWYWWSCKSGSVPKWPPKGAFRTSYSAYRDAVSRCSDGSSGGGQC